MKSSELARKIEQVGAVPIRQEGSHRTYRITNGERSALVTVPIHGSREVPTGTLHAIRKTIEHVIGKDWLR